MEETHLNHLSNISFGETGQEITNDSDAIAMGRNIVGEVIS